MEWLDLLGLGASAASGGLFGVLGAAFGAWMKLKERKQKAIEQKDQREHEIRLIELQKELNSQDGAWQNLRTSIEAERELVKATTNLPIVQAIKSLFRPFLTLFLWLAVGVEMHLVLTGVLSEYIQSAQDQSKLFSLEEMTNLVRYIVYSTVFSATTATTWWFGERALSLPEMKNR